MANDSPYAGMLRVTLATEPGEGLIEIRPDMAWLKERRAAIIGNEVTFEQAVEATALDYAIREMSARTAEFTKCLKERRTQLFFGMVGDGLQYSVITRNEKRRPTA